MAKCTRVVCFKHVTFYVEQKSNQFFFQHTLSIKVIEWTRRFPAHGTAQHILHWGKCKKMAPKRDIRVKNKYH